MTRIKEAGPWRVLIASSHPLFAEGLRSLLQKRSTADVEVVGLVADLEEASTALKRLQPDLVIVDYDDERVNREEFLMRFVKGHSRLRVVLLSLQGEGDQAVVYDRRSMAASRIEEWLKKWSYADELLAQTASAGGGGEMSLKPDRRDNMKHFVIAGLIVATLIVLGLFGLQHAHLLPVEASFQSVSVDWLFNIHFTAIVVLFSLIVGLMVYSIVVFRRRKGDLTDGPHIVGNNRLEFVWTAIPLITVLTIAYISSFVLRDIEKADPFPLEVNVIGSQWSWRFEYPAKGINATELRLPVDKQVLLHISSTDVIHSFWVPQFRVKQDALPGGEPFVRNLRITPSKVGEYTLMCAEMCGLDHAKMTAKVIVMSQADFDNWLNSQSASAPQNPVDAGKQLAQQFGCAACHTTDGSKSVGPTWKGLYESQVKLSDGTTVTADEAYLLESIHTPGAKIVAGYQNIMPPNIASGMSDQQINDLIAFIESLK